SPRMNATDSHTGIFIGGISNGFQISVPADKTQRRMKVYLGLYGSQGTLEASLSDSSAPPYRDDSLNGIYITANAVHTLDFAAASTNQSLLLKYTCSAMYDPDYGNVSWQAASLAL